MLLIVIAASLWSAAAAAGSKQLPNAAAGSKQLPNALFARSSAQCWQPKPPTGADGSLFRSTDLPAHPRLRVNDRYGEPCGPALPVFQVVNTMPYVYERWLP